MRTSLLLISSSLLSAIIFFSFAGKKPGSAQTNHFSPIPPGPRHLEEIAFDANRDRLLLLGGGETVIGSPTFFPDYLSEWDGKTWIHVNSQGPRNRYGHAIVYDKNEKATFLIGGVNQADRKVALDVWKWNGKQWTLINNECPAKTLEAVYDEVNKRVLVYGNVHNKTELMQRGDPLAFELWEFKNNEWKKLSADGPQISSQFEIAFDNNRNALVIPTWENGNAIVWEWRDDTWKKITHSGKAPADRNRFAVAYHASNKATYLFGGRNDANLFLGDFWKWDGEKWTEVNSNDIPPARAAATMEYGNNGLYLYGGVARWGPSNEIWKWQNGNWKLLNEEYAMTEERTGRELNAWLTNHPGDVQILLEYGTLLGRQKKYDEAIPLLRKAQSIDPAEHNILITLTSILYEQGKNSEAESSIKEAVEAGKMQRNSYLRLANHFYSIKRFKEAILCFQKTIQLQQDGGDYYNLACCYALLNDKNAAFEALERAIERGFTNKGQYESDTDLALLKSDARWKALLGKLK